MKRKYKLLISFLFFISLVNLRADEDIVELKTEESVINLIDQSIEASGTVKLNYDNFSLTANNLKKIANKNIIFSYGDVLFTQGDRVVRADSVVYDMDNNLSRITNADSYDTSIGLRFGGDKMYVDQNSKVTIQNGWLTTSPYEVPNYKVVAENIEVYPKRMLIARNIGINYKGRTLLKLPYYITSLRPSNRRATLFPVIGSDSDRGFYGVWGFDYYYNNLLNGFMDFELSSKKKLALKFANDYDLGNGNSGYVEVDRLVVPVSSNIDNEWDIKVQHNYISEPTKEKVDRKFYDLGYGNWSLTYINKTTNLMNAVDGTELEEDYSEYVDKYPKIRFYNAEIDQELGRNGELNIRYFWTGDKEALRELTEINNRIMERDELDPRTTDVDIYKSVKYTNGDSNILIDFEYDEFLDINPGYIGDVNSYRKNIELVTDLKGPKIKLSYIEKDQDEYGSILGLKKRRYLDETSFERNNTRWAKFVDYDKIRKISVDLGNYYPFKKQEFFGDENKELSQNLIDNFYFGMSVSQVDVQKKVYEYDFTRDNSVYNNFFLTPYTTGSLDFYNDERVYKIYENLEYARRAKKIIDEKYISTTFNIGNEAISLPLNDSYVGFGFSQERRQYSNMYVPEFDNGRKIEDTNSSTGYKIQLDSSGNPVKQKPDTTTSTFSTNLFLTLYDNSDNINRDYDLKLTNKSDVIIQRTSANKAMYNGYDIIETPTDANELVNDFNVYLGNVNLNYVFRAREDKHFADNWLKNRYVRNYVKFDIDNKRFISLDFENNEEYEFENYKNSETTTREFKYGYVTDKDNQFLHKYYIKSEKFYPYNVSLGWDRDSYKEKIDERVYSTSFNEWGIEYTNQIDTINDIFGNSASSGTPALKLKSNFHKVGFIYDSSKKRNNNSDVSHYIKLTVGGGEKTYRNINGTPTNASDDYYYKGRDYYTFGILYKYEEQLKRKTNNNNSLNYENTTVDDSDLSNNLNTRNFDIDNESTLSIFEEDDYYGEEQMLLTRNQVYQSYVDEEFNRQNTFDLETFSDSFDKYKNTTRYFSIGFDLELDSSDKGNYSNSSPFSKINDLIFKVEAGYSDKFNISYRYIMERPDRKYRDLAIRQSTYNYRRHDLEGKYSIGSDPGRPWWIGGKLQYIQDGAPKLSDPEVYESSSNARRVNKITLGMVTLSHEVENIQWEIGLGYKWDKPDNKKLGYYPVVAFTFKLTPFQDKGVTAGYDSGRPSLRVGM